jgi:hypothetical protein
VEDDQAGDDSSYSSRLVTPGELLSQTEKAEALETIWRTSFSGDRSFGPAVIETVDVALRSYFLSPASQPQLTTPDEVHEAIRGLKVSKAPGPNVITNRALKHLPKRAVSLFARIINAVLRTHQFPQTWKHTRVIPVLKPGKDPSTALFLLTH